MPEFAREFQMPVLCLGCDQGHAVGHGQKYVPTDRAEVGLHQEEDVRGAAGEGPATLIAVGKKEYDDTLFPVI
jgi:hypothetical protein